LDPELLNNSTELLIKLTKFGGTLFLSNQNSVTFPFTLCPVILKIPVIDSF